MANQNACDMKVHVIYYYRYLHVQRRNKVRVTDNVADPEYTNSSRASCQTGIQAVT